MKVLKNLRTYWAQATFLLVMLSAFAFIGVTNPVLKLDGGPPYNTNAPGEKTCSGTEGTSPCHSGGIPDNSGPGTPLITFSGGAFYVPGQTYTVTVTITHPTSVRYGFQIVSLKDSNNLFAGSISLLDTSRTRSQQPTWGSGQDRVFVMHRIMGTNPVSPGVGQWSYEWTAPPANAGNISFYACMVAANNNAQSDGGDQVYWAKITIGPSAVDVKNINIDGPSVSVYPNPASEYIRLEYVLENGSHLEADLLDMQGRKVASLIESVDVSGKYSENVSLDPALPRGTYLVKSLINGKEYLKKLQVQ